MNSNESSLEGGLSEMDIVKLQCGILISEEAMQRIARASVSQIQWQERLIARHPDMTDVEQHMVIPERINGIIPPQEMIVYGLRTKVIEGDEAGRIIYGVQSSADYAISGRSIYPPSEKKSLVAESKAEMEELILAELKRFLMINIPSGTIQDFT